ncbi:MAG TPA: IS1182 family transposase [Candidatus Limnocylindrales bacterium]|nr:IS1182 family transposase [Candidatus Limnocylindrales bacterium]
MRESGMRQKTFRPYDQDTLLLMPPSVRDWVPADSLAAFINDVVNELDLAPFLAAHDEPRGMPPYHPALMLKVLLYGYATGVRSSRKLEARLASDVGFMYLAGQSRPDHKTISSFRRRHLGAFGALFLQVLVLCQEAGLVKLGRVALDGTKVKANASKHKAMSYGRLAEREAQLEAEVQAILDEAEAVDAAEDELYGDARGDELPPELRTREGRLARIREAKAALEQEARQRTGNPAAVPESKAQRNFTDPESQIMRSRTDGWVQAYNAQAAVDETAQVIVAATVSQDPTDPRHLPAMVDAISENTGRSPKRLLADAGYCSDDNLAALAERSIDAYIAVRRDRHSTPAPAPPRGRTPAGLSARERMGRKLRTKQGRAHYARRKTIVEPVFGQIKEARGFRRFSLRGLEQVQAEWQLVALIHNLGKLFTSGRADRVLATWPKPRLTARLALG